MVNKISTYYILAILIILSNAVSAQRQKCLYRKLSKIYDYAITYNIAQGDVSDVHISIIRKSDKTVVQNIRSQSEDEQYRRFNCSSRSYVTGYNKNAEVIDGDWGDIVVADLNFDGKEDFAIVRAQAPTGAGIEVFDFYLQNKDGKFVKDIFLSSQMELCPSKIDTHNHILTTESYGSASAKIYRQRFKYNPATGKWANIK
jgi:hypothetical protein